MSFTHHLQYWYLKLIIHRRFIEEERKVIHTFKYLFLAHETRTCSRPSRVLLPRATDRKHEPIFTIPSLQTPSIIMAPSFQALGCTKQLLTHVAVGMGAASFWRGAWYILDDQLFPENAPLSAATSLLLGTGGMAASQGIVARAMAVQSPLWKRAAKFGALYTVAMSCVLVWRGTWVGWDCVYEHYHNELKKKQKSALEDTNDNKDTTSSDSPTVVLLQKFAESTTTLLATSSSSSVLEHSPAHTAIKSTDPGHLTYSGLASHTFAIVTLGACGVFASVVLAPPAAVSVIKDLAIQASRKTSSSTKGRSATTTSWKALQKQTTQAPPTEINNRAFEFIPHLAWDLSRTSTTSTRSMMTAAATTTSRAGTTPSRMMTMKQQPPKQS